MNTAVFGHITLGWETLPALFSIVVIDLVLAGDNAVVIAMAVRSLPRPQRLKGIVYGSAAAVLLRVLLTFFVARILSLEGVKLAGGLVILWIAVKLFVEDEEAAETRRDAASLRHAVRMIVIADITMSLDNMLAVGAASHGSLALLLFGLGLSIPLVVFTSGLLSLLMEKFPVIIYVGAALLGRIGAEMILTDPFLDRFIAPTKSVLYSLEIACAAGVVIAGRYWVRRDLARQRT